MKNYAILLLLCSLIVVACSNKKYDQQQLIEGHEKVVERNTSDQFVRALLAGYMEYIVDYPKDERAPLYLYRSALLYYRSGNSEEAIINLEKVLREYPDAQPESLIENTYLTLAKICAMGDRQPERAGELYKIYQEKYPNGNGINTAKYFFKRPEEKIVDRIEKIQQEMENLPRGTDPSEAMYSELMFTYIKYVKTKPDGPFAPSYAMQAARLAVRLDYHLIAVQLLEKIRSDYPDYDLYPEALLLLAAEYDTNLTIHLRKDNVPMSGINNQLSRKELLQQDLVAEGGIIYKETIAKFPDHEVSISARAGLKNLGKRTAKVVEEFLAEQDSIQKVYEAQQR